MPAFSIKYCEQTAQELCRQVDIPEEVVTHMRENVKTDLRQFANSELSEHRRQPNELEALENKQQKLFDLYCDDVISAEAMAEQQKIIETGLSRVRAAIAQETKIEKDREGLIDVAMKMTSNCCQFYRRASEAEKHKLNALFFEQVLIHYGRVMKCTMFMATLIHGPGASRPPRLSCQIPIHRTTKWVRWKRDTRPENPKGTGDR